jgi:hypothetical protein
MVTFIHGGREDEAASISASTGKHDVPLYRAAFGEKQHPTPWSRMARLNRLLSDKLPTDEVFIYPAMGDDGRPPAAYLLQQYISPALVALS